MTPSISLPPVYEIEDGPFMGGMGCVYKVRHREWNTLLAVKQPLPEMLENPDARERFLRECELWVLLGLHEHIVLCHYVRKIDGVPTVFAEWMPGGDLKARIASGGLYDGLAENILPVQLRLLDTAVQIARGMAYAHSRGLVHRDLKPANIMFDTDGTAKITDFGLAALRSREDLQSRGLGTAAYAAPEQQRGLPAGPAADLWSFGVLLLELFLGERLWKNSLYVPAGLETWLPQSRVPVPEEIRDLIRRCCVPDPLRRLADFTYVEKVLTGCWQRLAQSDYPRPDSGEAGLAAGSWNNRALSYLDLGMDAEAGGAWKKALRADPGHMPSLYNRTMYLWRKAQINDLGALRILQNAYNNAPCPENAELFSRFLLERQSAEPLEKLPAPYGGALPKDTSCIPDSSGPLSGASNSTGSSSSCQKRGPARVTNKVQDNAAFHAQDERRLVMSKTTRALCVRGEEAVFLFADRTAEVWNYRKGIRTAVLSTEKTQLNDAVFTPDGGVCAASAEGVLVFDRCGRRQAFFPIAEGSVRHVRMCGDGQSLPRRAGRVEGSQYLLVHAGRVEDGHQKEYAIRISLRDGKRYSKIRFNGAHPGIFLPLCGGKELILAAGNRLLRIDLDAGKLLRIYTAETTDISSGEQQTPEAPDRSPAKQRLQTPEAPDRSSAKQRQKALEPRADSPAKQRQQAPFTCAALRPDGTILAACAGGELWVWNAQSGQVQTRFPIGAAGTCHTLLFVRDKRFILSGGADPEVQLWELSTGRCLRSFGAHRGGVRCICAAENGEAFLSAGEYDGVDYQHIPSFGYKAAWKLCRAEETRRLQENERRFRELMLRSAAHWKKGEKAEALEDLALARSVPGHQRHPACLRLNAAMGKSLRAGALLGIWSRGTGAGTGSVGLMDPEVRVKENGSRDSVSHPAGDAPGSGRKTSDPCLGTDASGRLLIQAQFDGEVRLCEDGKTKHVFRCGRRGLCAAALSGDGGHAALGFYDGHLRLIDSKNGRLCWEKSYESMITRVCFDPAGILLLAGCAGGTILVYRQADGRLLHLLAGHTAPVTAFVFSPDGLLLRTDSEDGDIRLWQLDYAYTCT